MLRPRTLLPYDPVALLVGAVVFAGIAAGLSVLGHEVIRSDVAGYLRWSYVFWRVEEVNHLPLYPFALWLGRTATFGLLDGVLLLQTVSFASWLVGAVFVGRALAVHFDRRVARLGSTLFALFPPIGVLYAVYPLSDALALCLFAVGYDCFARRRWAALMVVTFFALLSHKGVWPAFGLLAIAGNVRHRYPCWMTACSTLGLVAWIGWGYLRYDYVAWLFLRNVQEHLSSRGGPPLLDGIASTFAAGGAKSAIKGIFVTGLLGVSAYLTVFFARRGRWGQAALALPTVIWAVVLGPVAIWAAVRFGKILAVPLAACVGEHPRLLEFASRADFRLVVIGLLAASQVAAAYYVFGVYFA